MGTTAPLRTPPVPPGTRPLGTHTPRPPPGPAPRAVEYRTSYRVPSRPNGAAVAAAAGRRHVPPRTAVERRCRLQLPSPPPPPLPPPPPPQTQAFLRLELMAPASWPREHFLSLADAVGCYTGCGDLRTDLVILYVDGSVSLTPRRSIPHACASMTFCGMAGPIDG